MPGFYGGYMGNEGVNPGLLAGNPFSSDFIIPQKRPQVPGGPQLSPLQQTPARIFPPEQPGREGSIPVQFRQAMFNYPGAPGNILGMQIPPGFQNKSVS